MIKEEKSKRSSTLELNRVSTEHLIYYKTLESKNDLFGYNWTFDSTTEFLSFWDEIREKANKENFLFRGVEDASFRLFNKAQRNYLNNKRHFEFNNFNYHDLIKEMISNARETNNRLLSRYFKALNVPDSDIAILSFLQHYGAPTPLLDWTKSIDIASFFATSKLSDNEVEKHYLHPGRDIGSYFSLYVLNLDVIQTYINNFKTLNARSKVSGDYDKILKKKLAYIVEQYQKSKPRFYLENSFNILNQEGVFIFNNSAELPMEEVVRKLSTIYYLVAKDIRQEDPIRSPLLCLNVNKGIIKHIRRELSERGVIKDMIFPSAEYIASRSVPTMLS